MNSLLKRTAPDGGEEMEPTERVSTISVRYSASNAAVDSVIQNNCAAASEGAEKRPVTSNTSAGRTVTDAVQCIIPSDQRRATPQTPQSSSVEEVDRTASAVTVVTSTSAVAMRTVAEESRVTSNEERLQKYDIFFISREDTVNDASKLAEILVKFCDDIHNYSLKVYPFINFGGNWLEHIENGLQSCTFKFIFIDDGFDNSYFAKFSANAALMEMIRRHDQSIVPVKSYRDVRMPMLLRMFRAIDVSRLLRGKRLGDVPEAKLLKLDDVDKSIVDGVVKMMTPSPLSPSSSSSSLCATARPTDTVATPRHVQILTSRYDELVQKMDPDSGLLDVLFSNDVIDMREKETIRTEKTSFDRNETLLKLLLQKSESQFRKFVAYLGDVNQNHVAALLSDSSEN